MEYAVIRTGGKQYKVAAGKTLLIEKIPGEKNDAVEFEEVLLHVSDAKSAIGNPRVNGVKVSGVIVEQAKGKKIRVAKYKAKVRYRRFTGHRQKLTKIRIDSIGKVI